jgi:hypothetical protein
MHGEQDFETAEGEDVNKQTLGEVLGQGGHGVVIRGWGSMGNGQSVPLALKYIVCEGKEVHMRTVALRSAFTEVDMAQAVDSERENLSRAGRDALCLPAAFGKLQPPVCGYYATVGYCVMAIL